MKTATRWILIVLAVLLVIVLAGPLVVPIPPLKGMQPAAELADPDSQFVDIDGLQVHAKIAGQGAVIRTFEGINKAHYWVVATVR